jgi:hypothetical protein
LLPLRIPCRLRISHVRSAAQLLDGKSVTSAWGEYGV